MTFIFCGSLVKKIESTSNPRETNTHLIYIIWMNPMRTTSNTMSMMIFKTLMPNSWLFCIPRGCLNVLGCIAIEHVLFFCFGDTNIRHIIQVTWWIQAQSYKNIICSAAFSGLPWNAYHKTWFILPLSKVVVKRSTAPPSHCGWLLPSSSIFSYLQFNLRSPNP